MKKWVVPIALSVMLLLGINAFVRIGVSSMGDAGTELYFYQRISKCGFAMRVVPFHKIEVWPIGPNVHGGMSDGPAILKIGR